VRPPEYFGVPRKYDYVLKNVLASLVRDAFDLRSGDLCHSFALGHREPETVPA